MILGLFIAALLLSFLFTVCFKYVAIVRVQPPLTPNKISLGRVDEAAASGLIPRIVWSYWHEAPQPHLVTLCQENWQRMAPDHEFRFLTKESISDWIPTASIPDFFHQLPVYRQADWIRIQLLKDYGGIWIDASVILTQNLAWVHQTQQNDGADYVGFYIGIYTTLNHQPLVENWFMAAIPQSRFFIDLAREFDYALRMGEQAYLEEIRASGRFEQVIQKLTPTMQTYLIMHVAASRLLDSANGDYRLSLFKAEDTALAYLHLLKWRRNKLHIKLALTPCPKHLPFFVKLRGGERKRIDEYLAKGWYYRGSLLGKFLRL